MCSHFLAKFQRNNNFSSKINFNFKDQTTNNRAENLNFSSFSYRLGVIGIGNSVITVTNKDLKQNA
jgi:hypothetical protein